VPVAPKNEILNRLELEVHAMKKWERPDFALVHLGAEVTAYLGNDGGPLAR
jgi:coenzyme PQQ precursor peptide PqqA